MRVDLSAHVTVFVITVGFPTLERCLAHVRAQDCAFQTRIIDHVAPMSAAYQRMLEECTTEFFVQVDEDMLLYPHAVRTMYERLSRADARVAQHAFPLYDVHLGEVIYGVHMNRHAIMRSYPFRDVEGCEWDQRQRLRADGFIDTVEPLTGARTDPTAALGLHGTYWTPLSVYLRFNMLGRRRRRRRETGATVQRSAPPDTGSLEAYDHHLTYEWLLEHADKLLYRFLDSRSAIDFFALMGVLSSAVTERVDPGAERDHRTYADTPGFPHLVRYFEETRTGRAEREAPPTGDEGGGGRTSP